MAETTFDRKVIEGINTTLDLIIEPMNETTEIIKKMAEGRGGSIVNVSSIAAVQPTPLELPYAAAKAGLNALTVGLARAFAPRVRVNCIMAGPFLTDISKAWTPEMRRA